MAKALLMEDVLAICLVVAKGNIDLSFKEVLSRIEDYEVTYKRHFLMERGELQRSFVYLLRETREGFSMIDEDYSVKEGITFREIIPLILSFDEVYSNDEGEYWTRFEKFDDIQFYYQKWHDDMDGSKMRLSYERKDRMREFFKEKEKVTPGQVMSLIKELYGEENPLITCSSPE